MSPDGAIQQYLEYFIAENIYIYIQVDLGEHWYQLMDGIFDHEKLDYAVDRTDGFTEDNTSHMRQKITNKSWVLLMR